MKTGNGICVDKTTVPAIGCLTLNSEGTLCTSCDIGSNFLPFYDDSECFNNSGSTFSLCDSVY